MVHNNTSYPPVFVRNNYNSIWEAFRTLLGIRTAPSNRKPWLSLAWCGVLGAGCSWGPLHTHLPPSVLVVSKSGQRASHTQEEGKAWQRWKGQRQEV